MARTIPPGWTQSPGCLSADDLWGWSIDGGSYADMLGGPTATSNCYPPDYQPTTAIIYTTTACPNAFTTAGLTKTNGNVWVVCCPTAYEFTCRDSVRLGPATMFCESAWPTDSSWRWVTSTYTMLGQGLQSLETYTAWVATYYQDTSTSVKITTSGSFFASDLRGSKNGVLWGMAVLITSTSSSSPGDTTTTAEHNVSNTGAVASNTSQVASITSQVANSPTTSPATTATAAPPSAGLSTGAVVGIGVAAGAVALLIVLGGWLLYRRGVAKGRTMYEATHQQQQKRAEESTGDGNITTAVVASSEWLSNYHQPYHSYNDADHRPRELEPTPPAPRELE